MCIEYLNFPSTFHIICSPKNTTDTIDLHGLHVEEAMEEVERKFENMPEGKLNAHIIIDYMYLYGLQKCSL